MAAALPSSCLQFSLSFSSTPLPSCPLLIALFLLRLFLLLFFVFLPPPFLLLFLLFIFLLFPTFLLFFFYFGVFFVWFCCCCLVSRQIVILEAWAGTQGNIAVCSGSSCTEDVYSTTPDSTFARHIQMVLPSLSLSKHHSGLCLGLELSSSHVMGQVDSGLAPGMVWNLLSLVPWSTRLEAIYSVPDGVHEALTVCTIDPCCVL